MSNPMVTGTITNGFTQINYWHIISALNFPITCRAFFHPIKGCQEPICQLTGQLGIPFFWSICLKGSIDQAYHGIGFINWGPMTGFLPTSKGWHFRVIGQIGMGKQTKTGPIGHRHQGECPWEARLIPNRESGNQGILLYDLRNRHVSDQIPHNI